LESVQQERGKLQKEMQEWEGSWGWVDNPNYLDELSLSDLEKMETSIHKAWKTLVVSLL
jgi:hypothetical protein